MALDADNVEHKVRLTGMDAPEWGQPFGNVSRKHLASMVAGKEVFVESDRTDRYGRELGKVWMQPVSCPACGKTLDVNHAQVLDGMAWWYRYYAIEQSPEDQGKYESAEDEAKARKWGQCEFLAFPYVACWQSGHPVQWNSYLSMGWTGQN